MTEPLPDRLTTGVSGLDRERQLGGIPAGSTIAVVVPPQSMASLLGYHLFATGRPTRYVATTRSAGAVRRDLERSLRTPIADESAVVDVCGELGRLPDAVAEQLAEIGDGGNFVLDSATAIRTQGGGDDLYRETVRTIQADTYDREGVSYVYFVAPAVADLSRVEWELVHSLDGAFVVSHQATAQDVETYLHVHKLRDGAPTEHAFKLDLDWQASLDASENIG